MGDVVDDLLSAATLGWWRRRRARVLRRAGTVDCALRLIDGEQAALSSNWTAGRAHLEPGWLRFTPRARTGTLLIEVVRIPRNSWREVGPMESLKDQSLRHVRRIGRVRSPTATLEWAVPESHRRWAAETVDPRR